MTAMEGLRNGRQPFVEWYRRRAAQVSSELCFGLDLTPKLVPQQFGPTDDMATWKKYLTELVPAAVDAGVAVFKPQEAYFGAFGPAGTELLAWLFDYIHQLNMQAILDAKRIDIGPTMEAYTKEVFHQIGADACTTLPFLGETFMPSKDGKCRGWMNEMEAGCLPIWMVRTSNTEGAWLQDARMKSGKRVYEMIAGKTKRLDRQIRKMTGGTSGLGGVVGATMPKQAIVCRRIAGNLVLFLVPGYGAQGAGPSQAVAGAPTDGTIGLIINSSRALLRGWVDKDGDPVENVIAEIIKAKSGLYDARCKGLGYDPYARALRRYLRQEAKLAKAA